MIRSTQRRPVRTDPELARFPCRQRELRGNGEAACAAVLRTAVPAGRPAPARRERRDDPVGANREHAAFTRHADCPDGRRQLVARDFRLGVPGQERQRARHSHEPILARRDHRWPSGWNTRLVTAGWSTTLAMCSPVSAAQILTRAHRLHWQSAPGRAERDGFHGAVLVVFERPIGVPRQRPQVHLAAGTDAREIAAVRTE